MKKFQRKSMGNTPFLVLMFFCYGVLLYGKELNKDNSSPKQNDQPPSVMFVIDHSSTMYNIYNGIDKLGNRFRVTMDLIDRILTHNPDAEVGVAIFNQYLYYDIRDDDIFEQIAPPDTAYSGYIPLLQLNSDYNGKKGAEVLNHYIEIDTTVDTIGWNTINGVLVPTTVLFILPRYKSGWERAGTTHINAGFKAVKKAMQSAKYPKENHFVIFISDGEANYPEDGTENDFVEGTDVPTTFTIYFTSDNTIPQTIQDMTTNIQNNGYSTSNPESNLWAFQNTIYDSLMTYILENILGFITDVKAPKLISNIVQGIRIIQSNRNVRILLHDNINIHATADIYNINGQVVSTLTANNSNPNVLYWNYSDMNGTAVPSGVYVIRLKAGGRNHAKRVIVSR